MYIRATATSLNSLHKPVNTLLVPKRDYFILISFTTYKLYSFISINDIKDQPNLFSNRIIYFIRLENDMFFKYKNIFMLKIYDIYIYIYIYIHMSVCVYTCILIEPSWINLISHKTPSTKRKNINKINKGNDTQVIAIKQLTIFIDMFS